MHIFGPCVIVHKLITHYKTVHVFFELIPLLGCRCSQRHQGALLLFCILPMEMANLQVSTTVFWGGGGVGRRGSLFGVYMSDLRL